MERLNAEEHNLYEKIKKRICRMIYEDIYQDGELIPPERKLSEELGVSRVTVRKALKLLEEEHVIERVQGSGTRVALQYGARAGNLDIITLVAPAQNAFFSRFIDAVQTKADEMDSLVLFKQKPKNISLEKCLYQIYDKDLRNIVLWLEDMELNANVLKKLRGLGMNIVLFDTTCRSFYADAVCLNNKEAVQRLVETLRKQGCRHLGFVGWDDMRVRSVKAREQAFLFAEPNHPVCHMPWQYHHHPEYFPADMIEENLKSLSECDGIIYSVSEIGIPFERKARELGIHHRAAMIDMRPGAEELEIVSLEQDFQKMAEKIFECLEKQNREGSAWKAGLYQVKGKLLEFKK
ncbi:MAG: GntR family transcriptional regulator [Lachnospiraceae bacterium]|nr:GntR family transcriptional regulator [Lachnospiraceae bacterium]